MNLINPLKPKVFPNEFGKKRHPLFFLMCLKRQSTSRRANEYEMKENVKT
jgi:hypothetical protein